MHLTMVLALYAGVAAASQEAARADDAFWNALSALCGQAFEGRMVEGTEPSDNTMAATRLVMHVRTCADSEIRVPFHVGDNRSRTWVVTRTPLGLRLKHDHRHEDGSPDSLTDYGGDAKPAAGAIDVEFPADADTAKMLPEAATNVWTLRIDPGRTFTYALRREAQARRFRVDFDLTKPVPPPPPPW